MSQSSSLTESNPWWANANIYEVNLRQYTPQGTFEAFQEHLPRLEKMGVEILWLMPIHPIGEVNRKGSLGSYYSVKNYNGINPDLGDSSQLQALINDAHDRGMKVILDWVANHSAWDHPWINNHLEWYTTDKNNKAPISPRNEKGEPTDWTDVADLNYDHPGLRNAMTDAMLYWVNNFGIDGYRCDFAHWVPVDFWAQTSKELKIINPNIFLLAECDYPPIIEEGGFYADYGWNFHHTLNDLAIKEKHVTDVCEAIKQVQDRYSKNAFKLNFVSNHDENSWNGSAVERLGEAVDPITSLAFTIAGIPLIYSGQEKSQIKRLDFFEKDTIDWSGQDKGEFFKKLLNLKKKNKALWNGIYGGRVEFLSCENDLLIYRRTKQEHELIAVYNFSDSLQLAHFPESKVLPTPYLTNIENLFLHSGEDIRVPQLGYALFSTKLN